MTCQRHDVSASSGAERSKLACIIVYLKCMRRATASKQPICPHKLEGLNHTCTALVHCMHCKELEGAAEGSAGSRGQLGYCDYNTAIIVFDRLHAYWCTVCQKRFGSLLYNMFYSRCNRYHTPCDDHIEHHACEMTPSTADVRLPAGRLRTHNAMHAHSRIQKQLSQRQRYLGSMQTSHMPLIMPRAVTGLCGALNELHLQFSSCGIGCFNHDNTINEASL